MFMKPAMVTETDLYRLLTWLSPAFPIGSFSYSHGIEYAVEAGLIRDAKDLGQWIDAIIRHGGGRNDALILCQTWRAVTENDTDAFRWAVERGATMRGTSEMALESAAQGQAFLSTVRTAWLEPNLDYWADLLIVDGHPLLPRRRWSCQRCCRNSSPGHGTGIPARVCRQSGLRRGALDPARPN